MPKNDLYDFERDAKGLPEYNYKDEENYNAMMDYNIEISIEKAKDVVEFNDVVQSKKKEIDLMIEEYNNMVDELLSDYTIVVQGLFHYKME